MMTTHIDFCRNCGDDVGKKLTEDGQGFHIYIMACRNCAAEFGSEWIEWHPVAQLRPQFWMHKAEVEVQFECAKQVALTAQARARTL